MTTKITADLDSISPANNPNPTMKSAPDKAMMLYRERGFHIETGLVAASICDELIAFAMSRPNAQDGSFKPIPMAHREAPVFLRMMKLPAIVEIVERLVGGRASGIGGEYFYMRPGTKGFTAHQDNFYIQAPPDAFVSAWTALCDVGPENGGLAFYTGSHKLGALAVRSGEMLSDPGQNPGAQAVESILPDDFPATNVQLKKGSVAFFHGLLAHHSNDNRSDRFRHSFLATYIRSGEPFRSGSYQKRTEVDLYGA